jgi:uncharacterized repeat protein (TIGR03803 family)
MSFTKSLLLMLVGLATIRSARAQTYTVLYAFTGKADGNGPFGGLVRDSAGNLYGTTIGGGDGLYPNGTVFKLSSRGKLTPLHGFAADRTEGVWPFAGLVRDSIGNLYGMTADGGTLGQGTIFKVSKKSKFSVLHSFSGNADGGSPFGTLILDRAGNLYGTTPYGGKPRCPVGPGGCGVAFKLDLAGNETVLRTFINGRKGAQPSGALIRDAAGNFYGTADAGGHNGHGTVFRLDPAGNQTALHTFMGKADGEFPGPGLFQDAAGNLYGTAAGGILGNGKSGAGVVFKIDTSGNYAVLYTFAGGSDGTGPNGSLIMDAAGNLYGTTLSSGSCVHYVCGTAFKLDPSGQLTVLYSFNIGSNQGYGPRAGLIMDSAGNLYGTASFGGNLKDCPKEGGGCGVVYKIRP